MSLCVYRPETRPQNITFATGFQHPSLAPRTFEVESCSTVVFQVGPSVLISFFCDDPTGKAVRGAIKTQGERAHWVLVISQGAAVSLRLMERGSPLPNKGDTISRRETRSPGMCLFTVIF